MTMEEARGLIAAAWYGEKTRFTVMDVELAGEFAKILVRLTEEYVKVLTEEMTKACANQVIFKEEGSIVV